jgi:hypothetical protein
MPDYDMWKCFPPDDPPLPIKEIWSALVDLQRARRKLDQTNLLNKDTDDKLEAAELEILVLLEELQ